MKNLGGVRYYVSGWFPDFCEFCCVNIFIVVALNLKLSFHRHSFNHRCDNSHEINYFAFLFFDEYYYECEVKH